MKGQISLDLLISLIITILVVSTTLTILNEVKENNEIIFLENNLKNINNDYAKLISSTKILNDTSFEIQINTKKVFFKNQLIEPIIETNNNEILIKINELNKTIKTTIPKLNNIKIITNKSKLVITNK